jgi:hypothetical protein
MLSRAGIAPPEGFEAPPTSKPFSRTPKFVPAPPDQPIKTVGLFTSPWVSGSRACGYAGPQHVTVFLRDDRRAATEAKRVVQWKRALARLRSKMRDKARSVGCNAIVGLETWIDLWATDAKGRPGTRLAASGTGAKLEPLEWDSNDWPPRPIRRVDA